MIPKRFVFRSFSTRLIAVFAGLLVVVQTAAFIAVNQANNANARQVVTEALRVGSGVFNRLVKERTQTLLEAARLLSGDFAFKSAYFTNKHGTILSAMENHLARIGSANIMMLVSLENEIIADTRHPTITGMPIPWPNLIEAAEKDEFGETGGVVIIDGLPHQIMVVPLLTPDVEAWILIGFLIDENFAKEMSGLLLSDISVLQKNFVTEWNMVASTLPENLHTHLLAKLNSEKWAMAQEGVIDLNGDAYLSFAAPLLKKSGMSVSVLMQRSLKQALAPYHALRNELLFLFIAGLLVSIIGAVLIARSVTQPVKKLAEGVKNIERGDYSRPVAISQSDEIGRLAHAFNHMSKGLEEKERVRALLGKVVSAEVAEELLNKNIALGGEEREVTVLFSDIRGFTTLCENRSPQVILGLLNTYLTRITEVIETHHGVVDKYIGDAVMALFGAPVQRADDAVSAAHTALGMQAALNALNPELQAQGLPVLEMGIGLNTGIVVAGNMGSQSRLNYTVIGDGVNLASRLESLSKIYGLPIIVSESTRAAAPGFVYRELDRVRVKGKNHAVSIYALLDPDKQARLAGSLEHFQEILQDFRQQNWDRVESGLLGLSEEIPDFPLYRLYLQRVEAYRHTPPGNDWDGICNQREK